MAIIRSSWYYLAGALALALIAGLIAFLIAGRPARPEPVLPALFEDEPEDRLARRSGQDASARASKDAPGAE